MKLVYQNTGEEVQVGDVATDREGQLIEVTYFREPHKPSSQGKVSVRPANDKEAMSREYYVSVIDANWIEREDQGWKAPEEVEADVLKLDVGDTLPNGALILNINQIAKTVLAFNKGAVQPFVIWNFMSDGSCYDGRYHKELSSATIAYDAMLK